jgi:SAM-dependent methyltransferase
MSTFSQELIGRSGYLDEGFADVYDRYRPSPPAGLLDVLTVVAGVERPALVVDLGCGTGLATRAWGERAREVVGVEPNPRMLERARKSPEQPNIRYAEAYGDDTGLPPGRADLVTSFQSFHWMEPQPVLAEAARVLRVGGVFAACDYDVPPFVEPEVDSAHMTLMKARREARQLLSVPAGSSTWPKDRHLDEIRASGRFRHARELLAHGWWETDAERMVGFAKSIGGPRELFAEQASEVGDAFERLRETAVRVLGTRTWPVLLCYRIRVGIK